jgi:hypothetical protein
MRIDLNGSILELRKGNCDSCVTSSVDLSGIGGGGSDKDEQTLSINSPNLVISGGNSLDLTPLVKDLETLTEIVANGTQYDYTKEDGTIDAIQAGTFISADTGNAIATGTDGGLMLTIPAQLPNDQLLSGDNSGNIDITLTPDTQPDGSIDYLIKADLPLATTTPASNTNALQIDANGKFFVEPTKMSNTRFVATANQTSFTLSFTPIGVVQFFRNGAAIDSLAFSVSGTTLTYTPANNGGATLGALVAGDIINVYGISK